MYFYNNDNWYYNPNYFNQQMYCTNQQEIQNCIDFVKQQQYENDQYFKIIDAGHTFREFLNKINKVDKEHQPELATICLAELADYLKWNSK